MSNKGVSKSLRRLILERDGYACVQCGDTENLEIHHTVPLFLGGTNEPENLTTLCQPCHRYSEDHHDIHTKWMWIRLGQYVQEHVVLVLALMLLVILLYLSKGKIHNG